MRKSILWILTGSIATSACAMTPQAISGGDDERQIRALYDRLASALHTRDVKALIESFAPGNELFVFDLVSEGRQETVDDRKRHYQIFLAALPPSTDEVKFRDIGIVTDGTLAFSHAVLPVSATRPNGSKTSRTLLFTDGLRKIDGRWRIAQQHISVSAASVAESHAEAQLAANESSAVMSLRTLNTALVSYVAIYSRLPARLSDLGPSDGSAPGPQSGALIDGTLASGTKNGYTFVYVAGEGPGGTPTTYTIHAGPTVPGQTGGRYFFTDESAVIRANASQPATKSDPPIS